MLDFMPDNNVWSSKGLRNLAEQGACVCEGEVVLGFVQKPDHPLEAVFLSPEWDLYVIHTNLNSTRGNVIGM